MKGQRKFRVRPKDIVLTLLPGLLWSLLVQSRPWVLQTRCEQPTACSPQELLAIDRWTVGHDSSDANQISTVLQNSTGVVTLAGILGWNLLFPAAGISQLGVIGVDLVTALQTIFWNGVATET